MPNKHQQDLSAFQDLERSNLHTEDIFLKDYSSRDWNFYRSILADVIRHAPPGKILDVGCGLGFLLECATRFGMAAEGIEGSHHAVQQCRERGLDVHERLLSERFPYLDNSIATVVINQVIEHLPRQVARHVLQESYRVLQKPGVAILRSPSRFNPIQKKEELHINLYSPSELRSEVECVGFVVIEQPNSYREFGIGRAGKLIAGILHTIFHWDFLCNSANCTARKIENTD